MEELQQVANSQQMGVVVLQRIVRNYRVHGRMVSNAKEGKCSIQGTVPAGDLLGPKIGASWQGNGKKKKIFPNSALRKAVVVFTGFGERLTMRSSRSLSLTRTLRSVAAQRRLAWR